MLKEEDPTAAPGGSNLWQEGINGWLSSQAESRYHPPTDYCGTVTPVNVEFENPTDHATVNSNFTVKFRADSTGDIVAAELEIDGNKKKDFNSPPFTFEVSGLTDGPHTLRAKARDSNGKESDRTITIGVNSPWNPTPVPTPTPMATP